MKSLLQYRELPPPADLADCVEAFWFIHTLAPAPNITRHWVLPEGNVNLVFWLPHGWLRSECIIPPILSGPTLSSFHKPAFPGEAYLGVRFRAGVGPAFFDCKGTDLTSIVQPLSQVNHHLADRLRTRLAGAGSESVAHALLIEEFRLARPSTPTVDAAMVDAAAWLRCKKELPTLHSWCRTFGLSDRQFRRRFTSAIGLSPKSYARIVRLQSLVRGHLLQPRVEWSNVSYQAGYADQSHLVNEFRALSGDRPTSYHRHVLQINHAFPSLVPPPHVRKLQDAAIRTG